jgi:hypothetical protein
VPVILVFILQTEKNRCRTEREQMIIDISMAYELGNALLTAAESVNDSGRDQVVLHMNEDTVISHDALDDGYDEGFDIIARVVSSS